MGSKFDHVAAENEKSGQFGHLRLFGDQRGMEDNEKRRSGFVLTIVEFAEAFSSELPDEEGHDPNHGHASRDTQAND